MYELQHFGGSGSGSNCNSGELLNPACPLIPTNLTPICQLDPQVMHRPLIFLLKCGLICYHCYQCHSRLQICQIFDLFSNLFYLLSTHLATANSETAENTTRQNYTLYMFPLFTAVRYVQLNHAGTQVSHTDSPLLFGVVVSHREVIKPSWSRSLRDA